MILSRSLQSILALVIAASAVSAAPAASLVSTATLSTSRSASVSNTPLTTTTSVSASPSPTVSGSQTPSQVSTALGSTPTVPFAPEDPNYPLWGPESTIHPEPIRGQLGATLLGPENVPMELQNPDLLAPPSTDQGTVGNAKWPFSFSGNRMQTGGWARQQNEALMPIATQMAGVNMRLEAGAFRELHWHKTAEWAYVISGHVQISSVDADGRNYLATVKEGDLWYFPPGIPHSLQATNYSSAGAEFLLVFPSGTFDESTTFQLTDWLDHVPKEVLAKNFQTDLSAFEYIPGAELYIFPSQPPAEGATDVSDPQGQVPDAFSFSASTMPATNLTGGSVKIVDSSTFTVSTEIAMAEVTVNPGAIRELHWHPTQDEWTYFLAGEGRITLFASSHNARTFNYQAGDIAYIPASFGHYVENTGNTTLRYLEIFNTDHYQDVSLSQWLALTPPAIVKAHLNVSDATIAHMSKTKQVVV